MTAYQSFSLIIIITLVGLSEVNTECLGSLDTFYILSYYINWVKTSLTYSMNRPYKSTQIRYKEVEIICLNTRLHNIIYNIYNNRLKVYLAQTLKLLVYFNSELTLDPFEPVNPEMMRGKGLLRAQGFLNSDLFVELNPKKLGLNCYSKIVLLFQVS